MSLAERCKKVMPPMAERVTELGIERAEGYYLYTEDDRKILDFGSGIAVCNVGHNHPKVVAAAKEEMDKMCHVCHNLVYYEPYVTLAERLVRATGGDTMVYFSNSGAEANEGALKLAKYATGRPAVIAFKNSFHGRTLACASITASNAGYRKNYEPLLPSVYFAEYPYLYRTPYITEEGEEYPAQYKKQFDEIFSKLVAPELVAAIIMEPVQGEGGYIVPPASWLAYVREICDKYGILLIFDEVQTGVGRTGELYAYQALGVKPDILTTAKALGGGFPLSAVIGREKYMKLWPKGAHGGTFGGNPVSCAAGLAVLDILENDGVLENCRKMGEYFREKLRKLQEKYPALIGEVRGIGLMNAIELIKENKEPDGALTAHIQKKALEKDLLLLSCGSDHNVIRFIPPLTITEKELDQAVDILDTILQDWK